MAETPCYHCGLPVPPGGDYAVTIEDESRPMCCPGCQAVATAIVDGGLERFYRYRTASAERPEEGPGERDDWRLYDRPELQADFVSEAGEGLHRAQLLLEGITCAACTWLIERHLSRFAAVQGLGVDVITHRCTLTWDASRQPLSELLAALAEIGYRPRPATDEAEQAMARRENRRALVRLGVAGIGMMQAGMVAVGLYAGAEEQWQLFLRWLSFLLVTPVVLFSAAPFFRTAWRSLRVGQLVMDLPVSLAIGLAYGASAWATVSGQGEVYFESVAMFVFFLLVGRYLEMRSRHRNRLAYGSFAQLMPLSARLIEKSGEREVPVRALAVGDRVRVRSGETFPCDGEVLTGTSEVVEALLTGESRPVPRGPGDPVVAGTLNGQSDLTLSVTAVGEATQLSAIERLVARAEAEKPQQQALADRVARYFIGAVLVLCAGVWAAWSLIDPSRALWVTVSVLVVTCPCALALAMPTALTAATANLRRRGFLIARGHVLETLTRVDRVLLDKTGTLTEGRFSLDQVLSEREGWDRTPLLELAAALEAPARHPLAEAFRPWAGRWEAHETRQYTAAGVEGQVGGETYRLGRPDFAAELYRAAQPPALPDEENLWLLLADRQGPLGWLALTDRPRAGARALIEALHRRGLAVELVSGDASGAVASLAQELGIDTWSAGARPEDKLARLRAARGQGERVLMVGDGINDVPVLASADVSVAMAAAADLAQTRADALLLNEDLTVLETALSVAARTRRLIRQNLGLSLGYNVLALPLAAMGLVPPWLAALGMSASSLLVVLNAMRLHRPVPAPAPTGG